jgi:hypothetical protein
MRILLSPLLAVTMSYVLMPLDVLRRELDQRQSTKQQKISYRRHIKRLLLMKEILVGVPKGMPLTSMRTSQ